MIARNSVGIFRQSIRYLFLISGIHLGLTIQARKQNGHRPCNSNITFQKILEYVVNDNSGRRKICPFHSYARNVPYDFFWKVRNV